MLTYDENERLTRVGPRTPMGEMLRRYWMPALLSVQVPEPDAPPVRVRLLGEDLVAFRDSDGRIGLLEEGCPHRRASLFLGRNEESGLRCVFHGWKFDVDGACVDMPNEPTESSFKDKIRQPAYPTRERAGIVWTYMGPSGDEPELPEYEWLTLPDSHRFVSRTLEECNFLQGIEGGIDTVHSSFLHNNDLGNTNALRQRDRHPRLEVERTDYGFRYAGIRNLGDGTEYVRVYQFVLPFSQFRSQRVADESLGVLQGVGVGQARGHMWVPIDDENTMVYNWMASLDPDRPLRRDFIDLYESGAGRGPNGETTTRTQTRANDWLIDRTVQRTKTFTGIKGLNTQDLAVQESMGPVADRTREHLGSTDRAIIVLRRMLLELLGDLEEGVAPLALKPAAYRGVRAADLPLPQGTPWQEGAAHLLAAPA